MELGDIIALKLSEGQYRAYKILRDETTTGTLHCLVFRPFAQLPQKEDLLTLQVLIWHIPIARADLEAKGQWIGRLPVNPDELVGYYKYLKQIDL